MKIVADKRAYIHHTRELPLFYQASWWDAICGEEQWTAGLILDEKGETTAVWPFHIRRRWGIRLLLPPPLTPWGGPWLFPRKDEKAGVAALRERKWAAGLSRLISRQADLIIFRWPPCFQNTQVWRENGFYAFTHFTRQISGLAEPLVIRKHFTASLENDLKAAEKVFLSPEKLEESKAEPSADPASPIETHRHFLAMQAHFFLTKGIPFSLEPGTFARVRLALTQAGGADQTIAAKDKDGRVHGYSWTVMDKNTAWMLFQVSERRNRHRGTMIWLIWQNILALKGKVVTFDLEGSMIPTVSRKYEETGSDQIAMQVVLGGRLAVCYLIYRYFVQKIKCKLLNIN